MEQVPDGFRAMQNFDQARPVRMHRVVVGLAVGVGFELAQLLVGQWRGNGITDIETGQWAYAVQPSCLPRCRRYGNFM